MRDKDPSRYGPSRGHWWIWATYVGLFALSIPWYLPADDTPALWLGLPYWVVISLAACLAIAVFTPFAIRRLWIDETGDAP